MVAKKAKVLLPLAPLPDLMRWWQSRSTQGILIGGLAASLLGRPRVTRDVDVLVLLPEDQWPEFMQSGLDFGFAPRTADTLKFAHEVRVLLLRHEPTGIDLDVTLGSLVFEEEAVARGIPTPVGGATVPLSTPEDLIIMKAVAHRDQDLLDIDGVLIAQTTLDVRRIRRWVRAFADSLESTEIYDDLEKRLARRPSCKRGKRK